MATLPPDATYTAAMNAAENRRTNALASAAQARTAGLLDYGYTGDAAGGIGTFDPNNPFSKAALLKQSYDRSRRSAGQSMAAAGNLYAGSYQNTQDAINRSQLGAEDSLQKSLLSFLARNTQAQAGAQQNYLDEAANANAAAYDRFASNPLYDPTSPGTAAAASPANLTTRRSAAHGGKLWRYRIGASGKLIPVGRA